MVWITTVAAQEMEEVVDSEAFQEQWVEEAAVNRVVARSKWKQVGKLSHGLTNLFFQVAA